MVFSRDEQDSKGKIRKIYDSYLTPFESLKTLDNPSRYLKQDLTMIQLEIKSLAHSDTEFAKLMEKEKIKLLQSHHLITPHHKELERLMKNKTKRQKGVAAILLLATLYGILPLIPRYLSISFEVFQQVYLRMGAGFLISLFLFRKQIRFQQLKKLPAREWGLIGIRAFLYYFLGVTLFTQALLLTKISNVSFIGAIPMTGIFGFILLKEKLKPEKIALVFLSFMGVIFISVQDFSNLFSFGKGELIALLSTLFVSLSFISRQWQSKHLNDKEIATLMLFFATVFIFIGSLIRGEGLPNTGWQLGVVLALILGGLLNAGVSYLMNYGFARLEAVLASNLIALEPVFAAIFAFIVFRELPISKEIVGGVVIIVSAIFMNKVENKNTQEE